MIVDACISACTVFLLARASISSTCDWLCATARCPSVVVKEKHSPATFAENLLHFRLLFLTQRGAEDRASVATELVGYNVRITHPQDCVDSRVAGLDHCPDPLDEFIGNAKLIFPRRRIDGAQSGSECGPAQGSRRNRASRCRSTCPGSKWNGERGPDQQAPKTAPRCTFARGHLVALIDPQFALVVTIDRNGIMQIYHPIVVQAQQLVEHLRPAVHVFLEANHY